ncbi:MAG: outer membrane beta-barrel protein [Leptospiraceae bacterium]|nr:outer membrane beta-barrel protein [Leptospiraceae bacterium]
MKRHICVGLFSFLQPGLGFSLSLKPELLIDSYFGAGPYSYVSSERSFATQAVRAREFQINLAHLAFSIEDPSLRGRLALQYGSSVNANYQGEPITTRFANQISHRHLQEAYVGYYLHERLWFDMGIFFSHIGYESWISHQNANYTRSLMADNSPYYFSGARLGWLLLPELELQLSLLNGWQLITPLNRDRSLGSQILYHLTDKIKISYANFAGNVALEGKQYRFYHNFIWEYRISSLFSSAVSFDIGHEQNSIEDKGKNWYGAAIYFQRGLGQEWNFAIRLQYYSDPHEVMVVTEEVGGFEVLGSSFTINYSPRREFLWRLEYSHLVSRYAVFEYADKRRTSEPYLVMALSLKV